MVIDRKMVLSGLWNMLNKQLLELKFSACEMDAQVKVLAVPYEDVILSPGATWWMGGTSPADRILIPTHILHMYACLLSTQK